MAPAITTRAAAARDLERVAAIYNQGIAERVATFETTPRTVEDIAAWATDGRPFIVAEHDDLIVGWARAGRYSPRPAYDGVGEHAVYVDPTARGHGLARLLLQALCTTAEAHGLHKLSSRVFSDNAPSLAAHRAAGFTEIGLQRRHGKLDGHWKDCVLVERLIGEATALPSSS